jgi:hypothetical protein
MSCFLSLLWSALTNVTLPVISSLRSLSKRTVLGTSKNSFNTEPISKLRSVFANLVAPWMEDLSNNVDVLIVDYIYATGLRMYQSLLKMICRVIFSYFFSSGKVRHAANYA